MTAKEFREEQEFQYDHFLNLTSTGISPNYDNIENFAEEYHQAKLKLLGIGVVVRSVFTIHSTEDEGVIKIVGTEEEAKQEVSKFAEEHKYADFFYEKKTL